MIWSVIRMLAGRFASKILAWSGERGFGSMSKAEKQEALAQLKARLDAEGKKE